MKKKPRELSLEMRVKAADALGIPRKDLAADVQHDAPSPSLGFPGFAESDVEVYEPAKGSYLAAAPHIIYYRVKTRALDMAMPPLLPGMLIRIDINRSSVTTLKPGQIVVAQRVGRYEGLDHRETIVRQFMATDKLCTNSSGVNEIERLDDPARGTMVILRGTMVGFIGEVDGDEHRRTA